MRILWISSHGGNYKSKEVTGTGSWIGALQDVLHGKMHDIELAIAFHHPHDTEVVVENNVTYHPISTDVNHTLFDKLKSRLRLYVDKHEEQVAKAISNLKRIIEDYKPDLVHVWGVENMYSAIIPHISDKIPVVVHIQGLASAYIHCYAPPFVSVNDINYSNGLLRKWKGTSGPMNHLRKFRRRVENELSVSKHVKFWIGRTAWDKEMSKILSPNSQYFHCDEILRNVFYEGKSWSYHYDGQTLHILSVISCDWYKGGDIILKTAKILKESGVIFSWDIYGWTSDNPIINTFARKFGINPKDVDVHFMGNATASTIKEALMKADVFVHPSYIENSSNAISEAMLSGTPVIANNVGGNASMLPNGSGILVPPNEPYTMAAKIMQLRNKEQAEQLSKLALEIARERHEKDKIAHDLMGIYETILKTT